MGVLALIFFCFLHLMTCGLSSTDSTEYVDPEYLDMLLKAERFEEFSKLLQITNVDLVLPADGNQTVQTRDPNSLKGLNHGDQLLRPWQFEKIRNNQYPASTWPNGVVPYSISTNSYSPTQYGAIQNAIDYWNGNITQIKFRRKNQSDRDYVFIFNSKGIYTNVGKAGGQQALSINSPELITKGLIHHALMHTIGFTHEQNRPDRDGYIRVLYGNIPDGFKSTYDKRKPGDFNLLTEYDYYSIMHYDPYFVSEKPAFEVLNKNIDFNIIGQRVKLTPTDKLKIERLYG